MVVGPESNEYCTMMVPTMGKNSYRGQVRSKELIIRRNNGEKYRNSKEWVGWSGVVWSGVGWGGWGIMVGFINAQLS